MKYKFNIGDKVTVSNSFSWVNNRILTITQRGVFKNHFTNEDMLIYGVEYESEGKTCEWSFNELDLIELR